MIDSQDFFATHQPKNGRFFTIAIDGRGGSGKSTFAELLKTKLPDFTVLNGDDYFEPIKDPIVWGEFNDERFTQDVLQPLKRGNAFVYRPYDWHAEPHIVEEKIPAWRLWQAKEDAYIRDFCPQEKADVVIDGLKSFEDQL